MHCQTTHSQYRALCHTIYTITCPVYIITWAWLCTYVTYRHNIIITTYYSLLRIILYAHASRFKPNISCSDRCIIVLMLVAQLPLLMQIFAPCLVVSLDFAPYSHGSPNLCILCTSVSVVTGCNYVHWCAKLCNQIVLYFEIGTI